MQGNDMVNNFIAPTGEKITWGDLKKFVETTGITDNDEIDSIDITWGKMDKLKATFDDDFGWKIVL